MSLSNTLQHKESLLDALFLDVASSVHTPWDDKFAIFTENLNIFDKQMFVFLEGGEFFRGFFLALIFCNLPDCEGIDCSLFDAVCKHKVHDFFVIGWGCIF